MLRVPPKRSTQFQSAGRIIGWLKPVHSPQASRPIGVSIRRADYWLVEAYNPVVPHKTFDLVSIRRADYWLVEVHDVVPVRLRYEKVSIRRADYWLVEAKQASPFPLALSVSIRRADYWLVEVLWRFGMV